MKTQTIRKIGFGVVVAVIWGGGYVVPKLIEVTAEKVADKIKYDQVFIKAVASQVPTQVVVAPAPKVIIDPVDAEYSKAEQYCMAKNIFHEAGVESFKGKAAVGQVTMNRLATGRWGNTICEVVYAKAQFSWTLSKAKVDEVPTGPLWEESKIAAYDVLLGTKHVKLNGSLFYHTDYIKTPRWADKNAVVKQVGQHIFYTKALTADDVKRSIKPIRVAAKPVKAQKPVIMASK